MHFSLTLIAWDERTVSAETFWNYSARDKHQTSQMVKIQQSYQWIRQESDNIKYGQLQVPETYKHLSADRQL